VDEAFVLRMLVDAKPLSEVASKDTLEADRKAASRSEIAAHFLRVLKHFPQERADVPGANEAEIQALETGWGFFLPDELRDFWKFRNGCCWKSDEERSEDKPVNIPSMADMKEVVDKDSPLWRRLGMVPLRDCYDDNHMAVIYDLKKGSVCWFDMEEGGQRLHARSLTDWVRMYADALDKAAAAWDSGEEKAVEGLWKTKEERLKHVSDHDLEDLTRGDYEQGGVPIPLANRFWKEFMPRSTGGGGGDDFDD